MNRLSTGLLVGLLGALALALVGQAVVAAAPASDTLVLAAYTVPKEAYEKEIIPAFQAHWKAKTGGISSSSSPTKRPARRRGRSPAASRPTWSLFRSRATWT